MTMKRTHQGSCHCGAVRFECDLDLQTDSSKCNCSVCQKGRFWKAIVRAGDMRVLAGEEMLTEYRFASHSNRHLFCRRCGIKPFGRGHLPDIGDFYAVSITCLDTASDADLAAAGVQFEDGRHDDWFNPPAETRHL
jgi:hypothetical protein